MMRGLIQRVERVERLLFELMNLTRRGLSVLDEVLATQERTKVAELEEIERKSDEINLQVFELCAQTFGLYGPVLHELRYLLSAMQISSFLERICDLLAEIGEMFPMELDERMREVVERARIMVRTIDNMIEEVELSLREHRVESLERRLTELDTRVDQLFLELHKAIVEYLKTGGRAVESAVRLLYIIRYLERIGDIAAKCGARLIYAERGRIVHIK